MPQEAAASPCLWWKSSCAYQQLFTPAAVHTSSMQLPNKLSHDSFGLVFKVEIVMSSMIYVVQRCIVCAGACFSLLSAAFLVVFFSLLWPQNYDWKEMKFQTFDNIEDKVSHLQAATNSWLISTENLHCSDISAPELHRYHCIPVLCCALKAQQAVKLQLPCAT